MSRVVQRTGVKVCDYCGTENDDSASVCCICHKSEFKAKQEKVSETASIQQLDHKQKRPKGIWVVTIWMGLFAGVFPALVATFFYFGPAKGAGFFSVGHLVFSLTLASCIIIAAIYAWLGRKWARYCLVVLALVHYGLLAYNNYSIAVSWEIPKEKVWRFWVRVPRSIITAAVISWYLLYNKRAATWFNRIPARSELEHDAQDPQEGSSDLLR